MAITSPFKKLSHSRENSRDEQQQQQQQHGHGHVRKSSRGNIPQGPPPSNSTAANNAAARSNTINSVRSTSSINSASLAQQYESDKQRLIKYCFSKYTQDGTLAESYITHVRLIEDSAYPSSKPPSNSNPQNKKHRILALAVLKDGTVRLHKGRENPNGSFQIGRTWSIGELSKLVREPTNETGFTVKLGKNYYWETHTSRERQVFVTSLVRIYRKFTKGFVPILINWDLSIFGLDETSYKSFIDKRWLEDTTSIKQGTLTPQGSERKQSIVSSIPQAPDTPKKNDPQPGGYKSLSPPKRELKSFTEVKQQYSNSNPSSGQSVPIVDQRRPSDQSFRRPSEQFSRRPSETPTRNLSKPQSVQPQQLLASSNSSNSIPSTSNPSNPSLLPPFNNGPSQQQQPLTRSSSSSSPPKSSIPPAPPITSDDYSNDIAKQLDSMSLSKQQQQQQHHHHHHPDSEIPLRRDISNDLNSLHPSSTSGSLSRPKSAKDVEIVAHRRSMQEYQNDDESDDEEEDDDITDMYQDAYSENVPSTGFVLSKPSTVLPTNNSNISIHERESEPFPGTEQESKTTDVEANENNEMSFDTQEDSQEHINTTVMETPATLTNRSDDEDYDDLNELPETPHLKLPSVRGGRRGRSSTMDSTMSGANLVPGLESSDASSFDDIFDEINWETMDDSETLTTKLMKALADTEYETTKGLIDLKSQSSTLGKFTGKINEEVDKLSPLLKFFTVELGGFAKEIQHVETESQGLQVETINKKTLWNDLQQLLNTVSVDEKSLRVLLTADLDQDLITVESILADLQSAIVAIRGSDKFEEDLGDMKALKDRRTKYENVLNEFLKKVKYDLDYRFRKSVNQIIGEQDDELITGKLSELMIYSGLTLFTKEVSTDTFYEIITIYESSTNPLYKEIFNGFNNKLINEMRQQEKFSLVNANAFNTIKSTKKKQHNNTMESKQEKLRQKFGLADTQIDHEITRSSSSPSSDQPASFLIFDIFEKIQSFTLSQQDFLLRFFHLSKNEDPSLLSYISKFPPSLRSKLLTGDIDEVDFDRDNARDVFNSMSSVFQPSFDDLIKTVVQLLRENQRLTPSVILYLEFFDKKLGNTNQEFLITTFKRLIDRLKIDWLKFMENQVKVIDKSILAHRKVREISIIVKNFTSFVSEIETSMIELSEENLNVETLEIRTMLNSSYEGLTRAIIKNLENENEDKSLAKFKLHDDAETKEKLNHTINLVQTTNWLMESIGPYKIVTLEQSSTILKKLFNESRDLYVNNLVHENFGKVADFVTEVEGLVNETNSKSVDPSKRNAYSKTTLNKILSGYTHTELSKIITQLRLTVLKHFDDNSTDIQHRLIEKIWSSLQAQFVSITLRLQNITERYYRDIEPRFSKKDVIALFSAGRV